MSKQYGATLAVALILLLIISILAIGSVQVSHMQEKMSANLQDKEMSFRAAESALNAGEGWLLAQTRQPAIAANCQTSPCVRQFYNNTNLSSQTASWWSSNSVAYGSQLRNVATAPRYIIEYLQFVPDSPELGNYKAGGGVHYYRITARGVGANNETVSILQTTVARRF
ncbi:type IV pilus assembly protein PilX [Legionella beliardensis]|uniref:Type IV pilus assembly protein PilX n=1 Tax=Legionella beliardensis TaxID=91822 RepID=A0A378HZ52_9GAMM|nr:PilX N-terminal domain-containing pilus assembly protein [Legionella beliardensis]STX28218.1 type IV pilus assembly protein PilX [Legionella beliardensis]